MVISTAASVWFGFNQGCFRVTGFRDVSLRVEDGGLKWDETGFGTPKKKRVKMKKMKERERAMVKKLVRRKLMRSVRFRDFRVGWTLRVDLTVGDEGGSND